LDKTCTTTSKRVKGLDNQTNLKAKQVQDIQFKDHHGVIKEDLRVF